MAKAVMEGVAFVFRQMIDLFVENGIKADAVYLGDGGCRSGTWVWALTHIIGCNDTFLMRNLDSSPLGAAIIAGAGVGIYPDMEAAVANLARHTRQQVEEGAVSRYDGFYEILNRIYPALKDVFQLIH